MLEIFNNVLKNIGCSYCQENDYSDKKEIYQNWKLYLKETDMFSALLLYNEKLKKDISYYTQKGSNIDLLDSKNQVIFKIDYISNFEDNKYAILVPNDKYTEYYEEISKLEKKFDNNLNAYYINIYNIKIN